MVPLVRFELTLWRFFCRDSGIAPLWALTLSRKSPASADWATRA